MTSHRLLSIPGSLRVGSYNRMLLAEAARLYGPAEHFIADLRLPLYDGDLETSKGIPAEVRQLADQISTADAVVIAGPEYNKSISGVLKNALDWISRTDGAPWANKPVAILSATAGRAGGEMTQAVMRACLAPFGARLVFGPTVLVGQASDQFDDNGQLSNPRYEQALSGLMDALRTEVGIFNTPDH